MNKQEQIEKMANDMRIAIVGDVVEVDYEESAQNLIKADYINGTDFVEWLSTYKDGGNDTYFNTLEINFLKRLLQEYLKGE